MATRKSFPKRVLKRQQGALERAEQYSKLTLDEKINEQMRFHVEGLPMHKQLRKLTALKEKKD